MLEAHEKLLWIGNAIEIRDPKLLFDLEIEAVVDVAYEEPPAQIPRGMIYCRFPLIDGDGNEPRVLSKTLITTSGLLQLGFQTVIACSAGMSRSPTVASHALGLHLGKVPQEILERIANQHALEVNPRLWSEMSKAFNDLTNS